MFAILGVDSYICKRKEMKKSDMWIAGEKRQIEGTSKSFARLANAETLTWILK